MAMFQSRSLRSSVCFGVLLLTILLIFCGVFTATPARAVALPQSGVPTYTNPLNINTLGSMKVGSCADPTIIRGQQPGDNYWYIYCTSDPLGDSDHNSNGQFNYHLIPIHKSLDLINWTYAGDVFSVRPSWATNNANLWAPDAEYFDGMYHLYYAVTDTLLPGGGSAVGVALSTSPLGPWSDVGKPAIEPHAAPCCANSRRAVIDPEVITDEGGQKYIYYGSFFGGISVRKLSPDGLSSDPASQTQITIDNLYEAADVVKHDSYYYLFVSAADCCNGPLSGYAVFVGRAKNPTGPFVDREGVSLLAGRAGGTPVLSANGNRWVGSGHNEVFTDFKGQDWFLYHAIDRNDPYFAGTSNFTKRPVMMDPLDWIDGWPTVRGGLGASDQLQVAPAVQPGDDSSRIVVRPQADVPGNLIASLSDEFNGATLGAQWSWSRTPDAGTYALAGGAFRFNTQAVVLFPDGAASMLVEPVSSGDYIVETNFRCDTQ